MYDYSFKASQANDEWLLGDIAEAVAVLETLLAKQHLHIARLEIGRGGHSEREGRNIRYIGRLAFACGPVNVYARDF